jgi:predicted small secreted protein
MKKFIGISILVLLAGFSSVSAQSTANKVGADVKKAL